MYSKAGHALKISGESFLKTHCFRIQSIGELTDSLYIKMGLFKNSRSERFDSVSDAFHTTSSMRFPTRIPKEPERLEYNPTNPNSQNRNFSAN